eukprot:m.86964 g.86964  ORF g.86964 m.86964 type:complete len:515 (+) comp26025_c0_seq2:110-1654(+)
MMARLSSVLFMCGIVYSDATWYGPTSLLFKPGVDGCELVGMSLPGVRFTPAQCQTQCLVNASAGCTAMNYNLGSFTGSNCQFLRCVGSPRPTWSVAGWVGYATYFVPTPPPSPPTQTLQLIVLDKLAASFGAACLDGSPPAYYFSAGSGDDVDKFVVFLNGGGWCYLEAPTPADPFSEPGGPSWGQSDSCWGRSQTGLGSTLHAAPTIGDPLIGTPMANWSKAWVIYCDGGSFSGDRNEPVLVVGPPGSKDQNRSLHFKGKRNLDAVVADLKSRGLANASLAVLGGCSAGGLGVYAQCDHFADSIPGVKSRCIGDAGVFIDATSLTTFAPGEQGVMRMQFSNVVQMQNASLASRCLASPQNTFAAACFFPQYVLPTMSTPVFVRNSFYNYGEWEVLPWDWHNSHNFTPGGWRNPYAHTNGTCVWETPRTSNTSADGCDAAEHGVMRKFQQEFSNAVEVTLSNTSKHGAFIDACATCHCQGMWSSTVVDGVSRSQAFERWLFHDTPTHIQALPIL